MGQYGTVTTVESSRTPGWGTVIPVWMLSAVAAVIIGVASPVAEYVIWLPVALAAAVLTTFAIQLTTLTTVGFVNRAMASVSGSAFILAVATGVLALLVAVKG